jgi:DNA-directed RNA polymerase specialized sigma24 family protein
MTTSTHHQEKDLAISLCQKQVQALDKLYDKYGAAMYGEIKRSLYNANASAETLQEVFRHIWQSADSYNPEAEPLFRWVLKIQKKETCKRKIDLAIREVFGH